MAWLKQHLQALTPDGRNTLGWHSAVRVPGMLESHRFFEHPSLRSPLRRHDTLG
jgi:hypothetical protein